MKKRLFLFTLIFALIFTSFVFGADDYRDHSWIYSMADKVPNYKTEYETLLKLDYYVHMYNEKYDKYTYLASSKPINVRVSSGEFKFYAEDSALIYFITSKGNRVWSDVDSSWYSSSNIVVGSNHNIYDIVTGEVFFSLPLTPLQEVAPEIFPLVKKQVGGITLGTVCLISVPILLILLGRLFRRWLVH